MARRKVNAVSLDTLIPQYAENKGLLDDYKKICDEENKQIKELMEEGSYEAGGWKVTKTVSTRDTVNEEALLSLLQSYSDGISKALNKVDSNIEFIDFRKLGVIKTKEYVDMDALESAIYKGKVTKEVLLEIDKCRESKEVVTLRLSKIKEKKDGKNK